MRESGLLKRRYGYYWTRLIAAVLAFAGIWVAVVLVGDSWWQLAVAAGLAIVLTQIAFLGHDSAHRQIFNSGPWNDWTSRILAGAFAGLSHTWWRNKHNRHHASPNQQGTDPDASRRRWLAYMVLNPLEAAWSGAKFGHLPDAVLDSSERTMRGLVQHDDVYALIQGFVYSMEFRARCAELRKAWQEDSARLAQRAPAVHADHLPGDVAR